MGRTRGRGAPLAFVNLLTLSRLAAGLASVFVFRIPTALIWLSILFAYILTSDILDGLLARLWHVTTRAGLIFDYTVDYFNSYLQIALLVSAGVPVWPFTTYMTRDLLYVFWRVYAPFEREAGIKSLSLVGTGGTYAYVLWLASGRAPNYEYNVTLFGLFSISSVNLGWRLYRLRGQILEIILSEFSP
jgi:phosphatidylglycerophosphate synthase